MELKDTLMKPCSEDERISFIIENNRENSYEIKDYPDRMEAWGPTQEELDDMEARRIQRLTCTKRVLAMMLEELGKDYYDDVLPLIESNRNAKMQWELCVELERSNPLIDSIGAQLDISPEQIDNLFRYANGEIPNINYGIGE